MRHILVWALFGAFVAACETDAPLNGPVVGDSGAGDVLADANESDAESVSDAQGGETAAGACLYSSDCPAKTDECVAGSCVARIPCASDKQCQASGQVCDIAAGACVACLIQADCTASQLCKAHQCVAPPTNCATTKECAQGLVCDKGAGKCVECATVADCGPGTTCVETLCVPMACKPGAATCADPKTMSVCAPDGSGWQPSTCWNGKVCVKDSCEAVVCTPGQKTCDGQKVLQCDATGTTLTVLATCDPAGASPQVCLFGACVPVACQAGSTMCASPLTLATCNPDGSGYTSKSCNDGLQCTTDSCDPALGCVSKPTDCDDNILCTDDSCDTKLDTCVHAVNASPCEDNDACTSGTKCTATGCGVPTVCDDGAPCTADSCDPVTAKCVYSPIGAGGPCQDGNACTENDKCDGGGGCSGTAVNCDDGDACTSDSCVNSGTNSCKHVAIDGPGCCNPTVWFADFEDGSTKGGISGNGGQGNGWQVWDGSGLAKSGKSVLYYGSPVTQNYAFGPNGVNNGSWGFSTALPKANKLTLKFHFYPAIESDPTHDTYKLLGEFNTLWSKATSGVKYSAWNIVAIDITKLGGAANANFQLDFSTVDAVDNGTLGILMDDVEVIRSCP